MNLYAVKQSEEVEDNSQLKDDRKDPKLIAILLKTVIIECHIFLKIFMQI